MKNSFLTMAPLLILLAVFTGCSGGEEESAEVDRPKEVPTEWSFYPSSLELPAEASNTSILVKSNKEWKLASSETWCKPSTTKGFTGETSLKIAIDANPLETSRKATLTFSTDNATQSVSLTQEGAKVDSFVPEGYTLVFREEFDEPLTKEGKTPLPNPEKWYFEEGDHGWGNHEIQNYIPGFVGQDTCAIISNGTLKIVAKKVRSEVYSIRLNSRESWTYGYFESRLKVPKGKGTWPAFWMLPKDFKNWPEDGEIDIMEHVGYDPNVIHCTVHTGKYNHSIGTQVGKNIKVPTADTEFHIYAVEWTKDYIKGFVDGEAYFTFKNDHQGDKKTWPFDAAFYLKLNLAWGGDWGGAQGVDESALPATYEIDYVRVYQK